MLVQTYMCNNHILDVLLLLTLSPILFIWSIILVKTYVCKHLTKIMLVHICTSIWLKYVCEQAFDTNTYMCTSTQTSPLPHIVHCKAFPKTAHAGQPKHPVDPDPIWQLYCTPHATKYPQPLQYAICNMEPPSNIISHGAISTPHATKYPQPLQYAICNMGPHTSSVKNPHNIWYGTHENKHPRQLQQAVKKMHTHNQAKIDYARRKLGQPGLNGSGGCWLLGNFGNWVGPTRKGFSKKWMQYGKWNPCDWNI